MINLLIELVVLGVVFYLIEMIPMDPAINTVIRVVAVLIAILIVLSAFGIPTIGNGVLH